MGEVAQKIIEALRELAETLEYLAREKGAADKPAEPDIITFGAGFVPFSVVNPDKLAELHAKAALHDKLLGPEGEVVIVLRAHVVEWEKQRTEVVEARRELAKAKALASYIAAAQWRDRANANQAAADTLERLRKGEHIREYEGGERMSLVCSDVIERHVKERQQFREERDAAIAARKAAEETDVAHHDRP